GLPYHIGGEIPSGDSLLLQTPSSLSELLNIEVRIHSEAVEIDRNNKIIKIKDLNTGKEYSETYDKLVLSPGASPIKPPIPGIDHKKVMFLRNIEDMDRIKKAIDEESPNNALIIGAGYIGIEMAENLRKRSLNVHVVELLDQILPPFDKEMARDIQNHLEANGVKLHLGVAVSAIRENNNELIVELQNTEFIKTDIVIVATGVKPETTLAISAGIKTNQLGAIIVSPQMQTNDPDIYAVGDAIEVIDPVSKTPSQIPLAGPANRQGRIAADNICNLNSFYKGTFGTAILKIFEMSAGCVGLSEKKAKKLNIEYHKVYLHPSNHAGYYPGATPIHLKLIFSKNDAKILGAQAVGFNGVDKRIDVLATAMKAEMTVFDLEELELSYAPPYGSAKDAINMAGFVAANYLRGDVDYWYPEDYPLKTENGIIIDVRPAEMFNLWHIPNAQNIPISELRSRLSEIPKDKNIFLYCRVGFTSYLAYRILKQNNFGENGVKLKTLSGGIMTFCCFHGHKICSHMRKVTYEPYSKIEENNEKFIPENLEHLTKISLDLRGLQCPGPITKIKEAISNAKDGTIIEAVSSDPGFSCDIKAWAETNSCELLSIEEKASNIKVTLKKKIKIDNALHHNRNSITMIVFSGDLDKVLAAFVIANGAIAMGKKVSMFFTFWGLNALRKNAPQKTGKPLIDFIFGEMMPKGPQNLKLSKMNMLGIGTAMMKNVMKNKNVSDLQTLIDNAIKGGVEIIACSMSMDVMGLNKDELIDGISIGGVATFLSESNSSSATLFI
ncbi:MAG TPA: FAD-dependent oxidoreductase, partial [Victivallales bacterium]|nr:FAD-dependent oxidoreductase [Victivallales bacterium]